MTTPDPTLDVAATAGGWLAGAAHGLIFDCDGTLADTMPVHYLAWTAMLAEHGLVLPQEQFYGLAGMPARAIIRLLADEQHIDVRADEIEPMVTDKELRYIDLIEHVTPIAVVVEVASRYRGILPLAVASGGDRWVVERTLGAVGILDWFDAVVCAEDTDRHKPDPDVFLEAARRLGVASETCVVFEDSDLGLEAARRAHMVGVDIRTWL
ncbi:MAG TPA: HAD family phosphatase [Ilumatobacteraceae bacterium]